MFDFQISHQGRLGQILKLFIIYRYFILGLQSGRPHKIEHLASYLHTLIDMVPRPKPREPWLRIVEQEEQPSVSFEGLLELLQTKREKENRRVEKEKPFLKDFSLATIILGLLIVALGAMTIIVKSDIATLKNDITDLKSLKAQVATLDPKKQITNLEGKVEDMKKERGMIKAELAQLQIELETIKTERKKENNKAPNRVRDRPLTANNTVREIKNKEVLLRLKSPQDMFFNDVSRAMSIDSPPK